MKKNKLHQILYLLLLITIIFNLSHGQAEEVKKFKDLNTEIKIGIDHNLYNHKTKISKDTQNALIKDFI